MGEADRSSLRTALAEVQELLETAPELGAEDRTELRAALRDIQDALADGRQEDASGSLGNMWSSAVERFEGRHPRLTEMIGRIADSLAELGI